MQNNFANKVQNSSKSQNIEPKLKGNTTVIFNKNMLESMSNPDISNILFLLHDIVNYQNQWVMFTSVGIYFQCETTDQTQ